MALTATSDSIAIAAGDSVTVTARAVRAGRAEAGLDLWAYVNGHRWGAPAHTDGSGKATFLLPLPTIGTAEIRVTTAPSAAAVAATNDAPEHWIWASATRDNQTVFLTKTFEVKGAATTALLRITGDDKFDAYVNGAMVSHGETFTQVFQANLLSHLKQGTNVLSVKGYNGGFSAGVLARLELIDALGSRSIVTDTSWRATDSAPAGWPVPASAAGTNPATIIAPLGGGAWGGNPKGWPKLGAGRFFPVGQAMPDTSTAKSGLLHVTVRRATTARAAANDSAMRVGMAYSPWFTPLNANWNTAEAIPVLGSYSSTDPAILRQHILWMNAMDIDFLYLDWSNMLWNKAHWSERYAGADDFVESTAALMDVMAQMRSEGLPTPKVTMLLGQYNGEAAQPSALDEEMQIVHDTYVSPAKYRGLWEEYQGKPLILMLETSGKAFLEGKPALKNKSFTLRYMSTRLDKYHHEKDGFWSWMDSSIPPVTTFYKGAAEAMTVTPALFGDGGWTYPQAVPRRNGATLIEEFFTVSKVRPRFLLINQWNEFVGQANGTGFGAKKDEYYDSYNVPLSGDIEPTSLTETGYRGGAGWGFFYLNLTRALIPIARGRDRESTILAISRPASGGTLSGPSVTLEWSAIGHPIKSFSVVRDGKTVASGLKGSPYTVSLAGLSAGVHTITVVADGATTRYPLSLTSVDDTLTTPKPCTASISFLYQK